MEFDYIIEESQVYFAVKETIKEKAKKKRRFIIETEDNLWKMAMDRINGKTGDC